ncbi:MAG: type VI secretion system baseplate subunit TssF [Deltaproteobacteria bacterium]|nr:type VI secretion system baseplate subunit TssF [Deltaproteobacteria bacterium]
MLKELYQEELANLRVLGSDFSKNNPALAPMLGAKGDDPDVERLLEGVAFLSSLVRSTLAEGFPDLIQSLLRMVFPAVLLPIPSTTMMHFRPVRGFAEPVAVKAGAALASLPVNGVSAKFTTTRPLTVLPAQISAVNCEEGQSGLTTVSLTVSSPAPLNRWLPDRLVIHLAGDYPEASERRRVFLRHIDEVEAISEGRAISLGPGSLSSGGFGADERALPNQPLLAFNLIQEYFTVPQKLLFLNIDGLGPLTKSPQMNLTLKFHLKNLTGPLGSMRPENFLLNACPAVNVFPHPAHPLIIDHRHDEYLLQPQDFDAEKLAIFSVEGVSSLTADGQSKIYAPFENFTRHNEGLYRIVRRLSPITDQGEYFLSLIYREGQSPGPETFSVNLKCLNVGITEHLRTGEICLPTDSSPSTATFANIIPPTTSCPPISADWQLWRLISHLHVNLIPFLTAAGLREILVLHSAVNDPDLGRSLSNRKRVESVESVTANREDFFIQGLPYRGSRIDLTADQDGFASSGDLDLFGEVLDHFFGLFHQINTYSRLSVTVKNTRQVLSWPPRLGAKRLV